MCGINGYISRTVGKEVIHDCLVNMNKRIMHRGPDQDGFFISEIDSQTTFGMAMRRLSVIDLSTGKQPIYNSDKSKVITLNGEIYNYRQLRADLIQSGVQFATHSDTEVVLQLFDKYGVDSFSMLDGMFAFSIIDLKSNKVYLARDFFGEKPLYYKADDNNFIWASELKSIIEIDPILPPISKTGLSLYFQLTYIPAPYSIYDGIYKLESNHYLEIDLKTFTFTKNQINKYNYNPPKIDISFDEAAMTVKEMVMESVASRSVSDVAIGTFLSGGVDSSIVSWVLANTTPSKINTFSIGFEKKSYDETDKSRTVAQLIGSNHQEFIINEQSFAGNFDEILLNFDEPFADSSALPSYLVAQKTKQHVTVALSGDGGDEVFGGYNKYLIGSINNKYTKFVPQFFHKGVKKMITPFLKQKHDNRGLKFQINKTINAIDYSGDFYYNIIKLGFLDDEIQHLLLGPFYDSVAFEYYKEKSIKADNLNGFREIDRHLSLEGDMLVKVDRTSMLNSLETRAPFLNKKLIEYANTLPDNFLISGNSKKHILKKAFESEFPSQFLEKSKQGFGVPVGDWLKTILKEELLSYITPQRLESQGVFNPPFVENLVINHINGVVDNSFKVWTFFCFQKWYYNLYK